MDNFHKSHRVSLCSLPLVLLHSGEYTQIKLEGKAVSVVKLWQGIILGAVYLFVGYLAAVMLSLPRNVYAALFVCLLTLLLAALLLLPHPKERHALFAVRRPLLCWALVMAVGMRLVSETSCFLALFFPPSPTAYTYLSGPLWVSVLYVAVLVPPAEELIFRGGFTQGLCRMLNWKIAIAISAFLFMIGHGWYKAPATLLMGLVLGYLCWYTGSISYGILIHLFNNATAFLGSTYPLMQAYRGAGIAVCLLLVAVGLGLTFWGLRGFIRCTDQLSAV